MTQKYVQLKFRQYLNSPLVLIACCSAGETEICHFGTFQTVTLGVPPNILDRKFFI